VIAKIEQYKKTVLKREKKRPNIIRNGKKFKHCMRTREQNPKIKQHYLLLESTQNQKISK